MGFFTIPVMALPALATVCWMTLARWHRRGREGLSSFVVKIAGWSVVALAFAGALYTPVLATLGTDGLQATYNALGIHYADATLLGLLRHSYVVWDQWHLTSPAWFQGALLALVLVGAAVRARTCRRAGTLVPAMVVATVAVLLAKPVLLEARLVAWALLLFLVLAGAGAATAFRGLTTRAEARWPRLGTPSARLATTFCAVLLSLACSGRWAAQPDENRPFKLWNGDPAYGLPALTLAVAQQVRAGDCITVDDGLEMFTIIYTRGLSHVGNRVGWYDPRLGHVVHGADWHNSGNAPPGRWPIYRASAPTPGETSGPACGEPSGGPAQHRLFVLWSGTTNELWAEWRGPRMTAQEFLEAHGHDSELVADLGDGSVFVFDD